MHMRLQRETAPTLAKVLDQLASVIDGPYLLGAHWANAKLTQLLIAQSAVLVDCFAESLLDPETPERWELTAVRVSCGEQHMAATQEVTGPIC
jgi:hypothetical protein